MAKPKKPRTLCEQCDLAVRVGGRFTPDLVHPVTGEKMLFDVRSKAKCPTCGAMWHRDRAGVKLVE